MFTQAFKESIISALARSLPCLNRSAIYATLMDGDALLPMLRVIEYNEAFPQQSQTEEERLLFFCHPTDLPAHLMYIREQANTAMNNYVGYRTAFRESSPNASSIVRVGLGLRMTVEEINSILLSYNLQTISWHRVDDMLLRYAVEKGWTYRTFTEVLESYRFYRNTTDAKAIKQSDGTENAKASDSAYFTRMNQSRFSGIAAQSFIEHADIYKKLHALFASMERSSSGAPRRAFLRAIRFTQSSFSSYDLFDSESEEDVEGEETNRRLRLPKCPKAKVQASYYLVHEAAGIAAADASYENARSAVNGIISAACDLLYFTGLYSSETVAEPEDQISISKQQQYQLHLLAVQQRRTLRQATLRDTDSCELILRAISRDLPQGILFNSYPMHDRKERIIRQMIDIASTVQAPPHSGAREESYRSSLYRLLLCCGLSKARRLLDEAVMNILRCMGLTIFPAIPTGSDAAQKARMLMRELGYTAEQQQQFSQYLTSLDETEIKAFTGNVLLAQAVTERSVKDQLSDILDIFDPSRRNSEPSRGFLMLIALYTYGYAIRGNSRVFTPDHARRYVSQCLKSAWDIAFLGREKEDRLSETVYQLIDSAFALHYTSPPSNAPLAEQWISALSSACSAYRDALRSSELSILQRYIENGHVKLVRSITCSNPLMMTKLVSGGWEF